MRAFQNMLFLFNLLFTRNKNVILGIAPYDYRMIFFNWIAKKHLFFYHTSWPYWDWVQYPKKALHRFLKKRVKEGWKGFLEQKCAGIFCVTARGREQLAAQYRIKCPIQIVYHSIDSKVFYYEPKPTFQLPLRFLFVGRLLEKKGIEEILGIFKTLPEQETALGIVGNGPLLETVQSTIKDRPNLRYYGKVSREKLGALYREYDVLLCPSKKGYGTWEELFGMSIIEGMACGVIPIATNHVGPTEIIEDTVDGFLIADKQVYDGLLDKIKYLMKLDQQTLMQLKRNAVAKADSFKVENISRRWCAILKDLN
jgi:glycosyltransferase involved in cell wall biosynthesis